jgi:adenosine/AMP kinase
VILSQARILQPVEHIHEVMVSAVPGRAFGATLCEAPGDRLVRRSGKDEGLTELAACNALTAGAGHSIVLLLGEAVLPINAVGALRAAPEARGLLRHGQPGRGHRRAERGGCGNAG